MRKKKYATLKNEEWLNDAKKIVLGKEGEEKHSETEPVVYAEKTDFGGCFKRNLRYIRKVIEKCTEFFQDNRCCEELMPESEKDDSESILIDVGIGEKTIKDYLWENKKYYATLISNTFDMCIIREGFDNRYNPDSLVEKWKYNIEITGFCYLRDKLSEITADTMTDAFEVLDFILDFLKENGVSRLFCENDMVTVSGENRNYFENGRKFSDGEVCEVEKYPLFIFEELYAQGRLAEMEKK